MQKIIHNSQVKPEIFWAIILIALFSGFLFLIFFSGFNLLLYIILAGLAFALTIIYPRAGLYALISLTLIFTQSFTLQSFWIGDVEYKFYLADILLVSMIISVWFRILARKIKLKFKSVDILLFLFFFLTSIYFLISVFYLKTNFIPAFSSLKNYIFYPLIYFLAWFLIDNKERLRTLFHFLFTSSVFILFFIFYGLITGQGIWTEITPLSTIGSRILDFNHAFYLSLLFLVGLSYLIIKKAQAKKNTWLYILLPIFFLGIIGSLMRHLWIALFFSTAIMYLFLEIKQRKILQTIFVKYLAIFALIFSVLFLIVNVFGISKIENNFGQIGHELSQRVVSLASKTDSSIAWRKEVWQEVWKNYRQSGFLGIGLGKKVFIDMGDYYDYVELRNMHNSWLAIFIQLGAITFLIIIIYLFKLFKQVYQKIEREQDLAIMRLSTLAIMIFCSISFLFQPYLEANFFNIIFWLNLGLMRRYVEGFTSKQI